MNEEPNAVNRFSGTHIELSKFERIALLKKNCDVLVTIEGHSDFVDGDLLMSNVASESIGPREVCHISSPNPATLFY